MVLSGQPPHRSGFTCKVAITVLGDGVPALQSPSRALSTDGPPRPSLALATRTCRQVANVFTKNTADLNRTVQSLLLRYLASSGLRFLIQWQVVPEGLFPVPQTDSLILRKVSLM